MVTAKKEFASTLRTLKYFAVLSAFFSLSPAMLQAQDQSNFTQFYLNPYILNSSYAGLDAQPSVSLLFRKQWVTIDGAPTITNLSLHAPLKGRVSGGVSITNDSKGFFNNTTMLFTVAYYVPVQEHSFVRFGLSAGGSWNTVDMKKLETVNDPALSSVLDNNASITGNAGISFHHRTFNAGIAMPSLFSPSYFSEDAFNVREVRPFEALIVHATNRFYFNSNKNIFEPYILYHINTDLPSLFELVGIMHLNHMVWAGASYKQYFGISALGGVKLKNTLAIGASYSIQQSGMDELNSPSFEVSVNYLFGIHRRNAPVYSFVNSVKPRERTQRGTARQAVAARGKQVDPEQKRKEEAARVKAQQDESRKRVAAEAELKKKQAQADADARRKATLDKQADDEKLRQARAETQKKLATEEAARLAAQKERDQKAAENQPQNQETVAIQTTPTEEKIIEQPAETQTIEPISQGANDEGIVQNQGDGKVQSGGQQPASVPQNVPEGNPEHEQAQFERLEANADDPLRPVEQQTIDPVRHEIVKRGDHPQELDASEYVIVGVFKSADNAQHFSNGLRSLEFRTRFGRVTVKDLWYVYILKTSDAARAKAEQARISKLFLLRDAWLLTVEP